MRPDMGRSGSFRPQTDALGPRLDRRALDGLESDDPSVHTLVSAHRALAYLLLYRPSGAITSDEGHRRPLRLSFASGIAAITEGVERLAGAWAAYQAAYVGARGGDAPTAVL
jgi:hypothetical protein